MCRKLFFALGLHLYSEHQLYLIICTFCEVEFIFLLLFMRWMRVFIEWKDFPLGTACIIVYGYTMFILDRIEFFHCLMYAQLFFVIVYFYSWVYTEFIMDGKDMDLEDFINREKRRKKRKKWW